MRQVAPKIPGAEEVTYAEHQPQYQPIVVSQVPRDATSRYLVARYTLTPQERGRVAAGEDIYFAQLNFLTPGGWAPMTPINVGLREQWAEPESQPQQPPGPVDPPRTPHPRMVG